MPEGGDVSFDKVDKSQELTDEDLLRQMQADSLFLTEKGVAAQMIAEYNRFNAVINDQEIATDALFFQIAREEALPGASPQFLHPPRNIINMFFHYALAGSEGRYIGQTWDLSDTGHLGNIRVPSETTKEIIAIARNRPAQRGIEREVALLQKSMSGK